MEFEICEKCGKFKVPEGYSIDDLGYEIFDYHRAILFDEHTQATLDGESFSKPKGRLGFFKRLAYDKGNPTAQWEDIIFCRIPQKREG